MSVDRAVAGLLFEPLLQPVAEHGDMAGASCLVVVPDFQGTGHPGGQGDHLGPRPPTRFLVPAVFESNQLATVAQQQRSDAPGTMKLVSSQCQ